MTPLIIACECGQLEVVEYLISQGANIEARVDIEVSQVLFFLN